MAATIAVLGSALTTTAGNKTVTATPTVGDLIVVIAVATGVTTTVADNGTGGSYTQVGTTRTGFSTTGNLQIFIRNNIIASAASTVYTATQTSSTGGGLVVLRVTGVTAVGSAAVRSSGGQSTGTSGTTPAPVLSLTPLTTNAIITAVANASNSTSTLVQRTGYTEDFDNGYNTPATGLEVNHLLSGETSATLTQGGTSGSIFASQSIELIVNQPPTTALNTPVNTATGISTTPTLNFTGTDADSDTVEYEVQVDTVNTFDSLNSGFDLKYVDVYLLKTGTPTDNLLLDIRSTSFSGTSLGQSNALASGSIVDNAYNRFTFATPITLAANTKYYMTLSRSGARDISNFWGWVQTNNSSYSGGGWSRKDNGVWTSESTTIDLNFVIYDSNLTAQVTHNVGALGNDSIQGSGGGSEEEGQSFTVASTSSLIDKFSTTDAGFTAGHPFASGVATDFTVQVADTLTGSTTYFWRVRAIDPTGTNTYGAWATTQSFTTTSGSTTTPQTILGLARITIATLKTLLGKAAVLISQPRTLLGKANIIKVTSQTILGISRVTIVTLKTVLGKAAILETTLKTILGKSRITVATLQTILGLSRITISTSKTILGKADILKTTLQTILGKAAILKTTLQTILGKARITIATLKTIQGISRVTVSTAQIVLGKSRITVTTLKTILGKSAILKTALQTILGVSRITKSTLQTVLGKARVTVSTAQTILGKARITITTAKTILGKSRITIVTLQIILGTSRITISTSKTILGKARITITTLQTILGKSRIQVVVNKTILGIANILSNSSTAKTILGLSRVTVATLKTVLGKAAILLTTAKTILGLSRITALGGTRRNLALNPSFEGSTGWTINNNGSGGTITYPSPDFAQSGLNSAKVVNISATNNSYLRQTINVIPGHTYTLSVYVKVTSYTSNPAAIRILSTSFANLVSTGFSGVQGFTRYSCTYTVPSTGVPSGVSTQIQIILDWLVGTIYYDAVLFEETNVLGSYFDGDLSPATWEGTQYISISDLIVNTLLGLSRVMVSTLKTILGVSRIQEAINKTILGKVRVTIATSKTIAGISNIIIGTSTTSQTILGKSSIQKTTSKDITGTSRIQIVSIQTILGKSRITNITSQIIQGKSSIEITASKLILGTATIIYTSVDQDIQGVSRVTVHTHQTMKGRALIKSTINTPPQFILVDGKLGFHLVDDIYTRI